MFQRKFEEIQRSRDIDSQQSVKQSQLLQREIERRKIAQMHLEELKGEKRVLQNELNSVRGQILRNSEIKDLSSDRSVAFTLEQLQQENAKFREHISMLKSSGREEEIMRLNLMTSHLLQANEEHRASLEKESSKRQHIEDQLRRLKKKYEEFLKIHEQEVHNLKEEVNRVEVCRSNSVDACNVLSDTLCEMIEWTISRIVSNISNQRLDADDDATTQSMGNIRDINRITRIVGKSAIASEDVKLMHAHLLRGETANIIKLALKRYESSKKNSHIVDILEMGQEGSFESLNLAQLDIMKVPPSTRDVFVDTSDLLPLPPQSVSLSEPKLEENKSNVILNTEQQLSNNNNNNNIVISSNLPFPPPGSDLNSNMVLFPVSPFLKKQAITQPFFEPAEGTFAAEDPSRPHSSLLASPNRRAMIVNRSLKKFASEEAKTDSANNFDVIKDSVQASDAVQKVDTHLDNNNQTESFSESQLKNDTEDNKNTNNDLTHCAELCPDRSIQIEQNPPCDEEFVSLPPSEKASLKTESKTIEIPIFSNNLELINHTTDEKIPLQNHSEMNDQKSISNCNSSDSEPKLNLNIGVGPAAALILTQQIESYKSQTNINSNDAIQLNQPQEKAYSQDIQLVNEDQQLFPQSSNINNISNEKHFEELDKADVFVFPAPADGLPLRHLVQTPSSDHFSSSSHLHHDEHLTVSDQIKLENDNKNGSIHGSIHGILDVNYVHSMDSVGEEQNISATTQEEKENQKQEQDPSTTNDASLASPIFILHPLPSSESADRSVAVNSNFQLNPSSFTQQSSNLKPQQLLHVPISPQNNIVSGGLPEGVQVEDEDPSKTPLCDTESSGHLNISSNGGDVTTVLGEEKMPSNFKKTLATNNFGIRIDTSSQSIKSKIFVKLVDIVRSSPPPAGVHVNFAPSVSGVSSVGMFAPTWGGLKVEDLCLIVLFATDNDVTDMRSKESRQLYFDDLVRTDTDEVSIEILREFTSSILNSASIIASPRGAVNGVYGAGPPKSSEAGLLFASGGYLCPPPVPNHAASDDGSTFLSTSTSHFKPLGDLVLELWDTNRGLCIGATRPKLFRPLKDEVSDIFAYPTDSDLEGSDDNARARRWTPRHSVGRISISVEIESAPAVFIEFLENISPSMGVVRERRQSTGSADTTFSRFHERDNPFGVPPTPLVGQTSVSGEVEVSSGPVEGPVKVDDVKEVKI